MVLLSALAAAAAQEVPIPSSPDGFRYNVTGNRSAPVQIEGYFDLMCPDTRVRAACHAMYFHASGGRGTWGVYQQAGQCSFCQLFVAQFAATP